MTKAELKSQFQNSYNRESWMPILKLVFGQINFFSNPVPLFESEEAVKQGFQIGYVDLPNKQTVAIFEIEVADRIIIERNRKGLRDIAAKYIQGTFSAALVFYYSKNQTEYRFSFVAQQSKIDEQTGEFNTVVTAPKRYTYVLGTPFCATAAERWIKLAAEPEINVDKITDAFSVEKLSKDFFDQYKIQYTRFCKFIEDDSVTLQQFIDHTETDAVKAQKPLRDYVKKLLGRLVFLQFLQKKGWMGVPAVNKDWKGGDLNFMANLFDKSPYQSNYLDQVLEPLFFNTLNRERTNDIADKIDTEIKIPYLNGGLFEPTTLDDTRVQFPKHYFSELFEFFNQYNFTIDENDPDDAEVGIDPEMLGHIFENLLEDNKDKGAFYTPKEIVRYMCQESLIAYLHTHTPEALHPSVEKLIRTHKVDDCLQDKPNATLIQKLLVVVKICDPAIGSGAFPMGMLNEIFMVRRLLFGFLGKNHSFSACLVKKEIIQNNIYGVDIEHGAVDIARLRFWLSLVVDEDVPQALPNLDYKIVCGNSLISRFPLDCDINEVFKEYNKTEEGKKEPLTLQRYKDEVANYTDEHSEKTTQKKKIEAIKSAFKMYLSFGDRTQIKKLAKKVVSYDGLFGLQKIDLKDAKQKEAYDRNEELKTQISNLQNQQQEVINNKLYENSFEWRFEFPSLLDDSGNFTGFDVVIGNPPYVEAKKLKAISIQLKKNFCTYSGTADLSIYFVEQGLRLNKESGYLSYITTNKFFNTGYGMSVRCQLLENTIRDIVNFEQVEVFEGVLVSSVILGVLKIKPKIENEFKYDKFYKLKAKVFKSQFAKSINEISLYKQSNLDTNEWSFADTTHLSIKEKIEKNGRILTAENDKVYIYRGVTTGFNPAFIIDTAKKNELIAADTKNKNIIKPLLQGRNIRKWRYNYNNENLIFTKQGIEINNYPLVKEYLKEFYSELKPRENDNEKTGRKPGSYKWYEIQDNTAYYPEFEKPEKIIWGLTADKWAFAYDDQQHYLPSNGYILTSDIIPIKYLIGLLNSKLMNYYFGFIGVMTAGGAYTLKHGTIQKMPLKIAINTVPIIKLVEVLLSCKGDLKVQSKNEQQIDTLVYKLYELSYEEVLLIEPDFGKRVSVEQYEAVNVE